MMSSYDDGIREGSAPSAARVGADLRAARERLGWTLPAIAGYLRIRLAFLEAIEDGRTADLPGNAYAVGFLRTYAQAIGLDPDEIARRFRAEAELAPRPLRLLQRPEPIEAVAEVPMEEDGVLRDFDTPDSLATLPQRLRPEGMQAG